MALERCYLDGGLQLDAQDPFVCLCQLFVEFPRTPLVGLGGEAITILIDDVVTPGTAGP
jgi:hypothetical protein